MSTMQSFPFTKSNQIKSYGPTVKSAQVLMITCCCIWLFLTRRACHYFELWQQQQHHHHSTIVKCDVCFTANPPSHPAHTVDAYTIQIAVKIIHDIEFFKLWEDISVKYCFIIIVFHFLFKQTKFSNS